MDLIGDQSVAAVAQELAAQSAGPEDAQFVTHTQARAHRIATWRRRVRVGLSLLHIILSIIVVSVWMHSLAPLEPGQLGGQAPQRLMAVVCVHTLALALQTLLLLVVPVRYSRLINVMLTVMFVVCAGFPMCVFLSDGQRLDERTIALLLAQLYAWPVVFGLPFVLHILAILLLTPIFVAAVLLGFAVSRGSTDVLVPGTHCGVTCESGAAAAGTLATALAVGIFAILTALPQWYAYERHRAQRAALAVLAAEARSQKVLLRRVIPSVYLDALESDDRSKARMTSKPIPDVSVIFCEVVTIHADADTGARKPRKLGYAVQQNTLTVLAHVFKLLDRVVLRNGVMKVETIGSEFMAVSGLPHMLPHHPNSAYAAIVTALDMMRAVAREMREGRLGQLAAGMEIGLQIGINSGPVVESILGRKMLPRWKLFGDTVNTASRMKFYSTFGRIHLSRTTRNLLMRDAAWIISRARQGFAPDSAQDASKSTPPLHVRPILAGGVTSTTGGWVEPPRPQLSELPTVESASVASRANTGASSDPQSKRRLPPPLSTNPESRTLEVAAVTPSHVSQAAAPQLFSPGPVLSRGFAFQHLSQPAGNAGNGGDTGFMTATSSAAAASSAEVQTSAAVWPPMDDDIKRVFYTPDQVDVLLPAVADAVKLDAAASSPAAPHAATAAASSASAPPASAAATAPVADPVAASPPAGPAVAVVANQVFGHGACPLTDGDIMFAQAVGWFLRPREAIQVKGKGLMHTYFVEVCIADKDQRASSRLLSRLRQNGAWDAGANPAVDPGQVDGDGVLSPVMLAETMLVDDAHIQWLRNHDAMGWNRHRQSLLIQHASRRRPRRWSGRGFASRAGPLADVFVGVHGEGVGGDVGATVGVPHQVIRAAKTTAAAMKTLPEHRAAKLAYIRVTSNQIGRTVTAMPGLLVDAAPAVTGDGAVMFAQLLPRIVSEDPDDSPSAHASASSPHVEGDAVPAHALSDPMEARAPSPGEESPSAPNMAALVAQHSGLSAAGPSLGRADDGAHIIHAASPQAGASFKSASPVEASQQLNRVPEVDEYDDDEERADGTSISSPKRPRRSDADSLTGVVSPEAEGRTLGDLSDVEGDLTSTVPLASVLLKRLRSDRDGMLRTSCAPSSATLHRLASNRTMSGRQPGLLAQASMRLGFTSDASEVQAGTLSSAFAWAVSPSYRNSARRQHFFGADRSDTAATAAAVSSRRGAHVAGYSAVHMSTSAPSVADTFRTAHLPTQREAGMADAAHAGNVVPSTAAGSHRASPLSSRVTTADAFTTRAAAPRGFILPSPLSSPHVGPTVTMPEGIPMDNPTVVHASPEPLSLTLAVDSDVAAPRYALSPSRSRPQSGRQRPGSAPRSRPASARQRVSGAGVDPALIPSETLDRGNSAEPDQQPAPEPQVGPATMSKQRQMMRSNTRRNSAELMQGSIVSPTAARNSRLPGGSTRDVFDWSQSTAAPPGAAGALGGAHIDTEMFVDEPTNWLQDLMPVLLPEQALVEPELNPWTLRFVDEQAKLEVVYALSAIVRHTTANTASFIGICLYVVGCIAVIPRLGYVSAWVGVALAAVCVVCFAAALVVSRRPANEALTEYHELRGTSEVLARCRRLVNLYGTLILVAVLCALTLACLAFQAIGSDLPESLFQYRRDQRLPRTDWSWQRWYNHMTVFATTVFLFVFMLPHFTGLVFAQALLPTICAVIVATVLLMLQLARGEAIAAWAALLTMTTVSLMSAIPAEVRLRSAFLDEALAHEQQAKTQRMLHAMLPPTIVDKMLARENVRAAAKMARIQQRRDFTRDEAFLQSATKPGVDASLDGPDAFWIGTCAEATLAWRACRAAMGFAPSTVAPDLPHATSGAGIGSSGVVASNTDHSPRRLVDMLTGDPGADQAVLGGDAVAPFAGLAPKPRPKQPTVADSAPRHALQGPSSGTSHGDSRKARILHSMSTDDDGYDSEGSDGDGDGEATHRDAPVPGDNPECVVHVLPAGESASGSPISPISVSGSVPPLAGPSGLAQPSRYAADTAHPTPPPDSRSPPSAASPAERLFRTLPGILRQSTRTAPAATQRGDHSAHATDAVRSDSHGHTRTRDQSGFDDVSADGSKGAHRARSVEEAIRGAATAPVSDPAPLVAIGRRISMLYRRAEQHQVALLMFDLVGFTTLSAAVGPHRVVELLDRLYASFDRVVAKRGALKVETIGDAMLVACGVPTSVDIEVSVRVIAKCALDMIRIVQQFSQQYKQSLLQNHTVQARIGVHVGTVLAGVIGDQMPRYQLFGVAVDEAQAMESSSEPGQVHASAEFLRVLETEIPVSRAAQLDLITTRPQPLARREPGFAKWLRLQDSVGNTVPAPLEPPTPSAASHGPMSPASSPHTSPDAASARPRRITPVANVATAAAARHRSLSGNPLARLGASIRMLRRGSEETVRIAPDVKVSRTLPDGTGFLARDRSATLTGIPW